MITKIKNENANITEAGLREILSGKVEVMEIDRKDFDISVLSNIHYGENEGIGVYYPIYRDGSCAEAQYFKFRLALSTTTSFSYILKLKYWASAQLPSRYTG